MGSNNARVSRSFHTDHNIKDPMKLKRKTPSRLFPSPYKTKYTRYPIHFYISYLIDIHIPGGDGFELCRMIRKQENTPVIFLTGVNDEASIVFGLGLGADDYITKPFTLQVLLARIKTVLRRNQRDVNKARKVKSGNLIIDFDHRTVHSEGKEIAVTPTQFHILKLLVSNHGITITRDQITSILWNQNDEFVEDNTLSVHISNLKSKIGKFNGKPYLESVRGVGYQWKLDVVLYTD